MHRRRQTEQSIQRAIVSHLRTHGARGLYWYAIPNGGLRSRREASIMAGTGTKPGTPDLGFVHQGRAYFLEVKSESGRLTEQQLQINNAGGYAAMGQGIDACLQILREWGLLRGRVT
jgi:hypothetical protein